MMHDYSSAYNNLMVDNNELHTIHTFMKHIFQIFNLRLWNILTAIAITIDLLSIIGVTFNLI